MRFSAAALGAHPGAEADPGYLNDLLRNLIGSDPSLPVSGWRVVALDGDSAEFAAVVDARRNAYPALVTATYRWYDRRWRYAGYGDCRPQAVTDDGIGEAWRLDPRFPRPMRDTTVLHLLVGDCHQLAASDIGRPDVEELASAVLVMVPIESGGGDACDGGSPRTPLSVRLPHALGERSLYDAAYLPVRPR